MNVQDVASYLPPWLYQIYGTPDFICSSCNCSSFRQT